MDFYDTYFSTYLQKNKQHNLHPELDTIIESKLPKTIETMPNLILFGESGSGKYTQSLRIIEKYSANKLNKTNFTNYCIKNKTAKLNDKDNLIFKNSDIHYEIDMYLLGCESKKYWEELLALIIEEVKYRKNKNVIILCLNFDKTHQELLENFHNYLNHSIFETIAIKYIFLCDNISFIPIQLLQFFNIINICKPSIEQLNCILSDKNQYNENFNSHLEYITENNNLKNIYGKKNNNTLFNKMFERIYEIYIINKFDKNIVSLMRNIAYDILVNNIDFYEILQKINWDLIKNNKNNIKLIKYLQNDLPNDLLYLNNNYRTIFHIENILLKLYNLQKI